MESQEIHGFMNPLEMSQEEMRNLGYRVIETVIEHFEQLRYKPVTRVADRLELEQRLCEPIPEKGTAINKMRWFLGSIFFQVLGKKALAQR